MSQQWFYSKDGKGKVGPVSSAELQALAKSGQLLSTDMVWKEGMSQWVAASAIKGLFANVEANPKRPRLPIPPDPPLVNVQAVDVGRADASNLGG